MIPDCLRILRLGTTHALDSSMKQLTIVTKKINTEQLKQLELLGYKVLVVLK